MMEKGGLDLIVTNSQILADRVHLSSGAQVEIQSSKFAICKAKTVTPSGQGTRFVVLPDSGPQMGSIISCSAALQKEASS